MCALAWIGFDTHRLPPVGVELHVVLTAFASLLSLEKLGYTSRLMEFLLVTEDELTVLHCGKDRTLGLLSSPHSQPTEREVSKIGQKGRRLSEWFLLFWY